MRSRLLLFGGTVAVWYAIAWAEHTPYLVPYPHVVLGALLANPEMYLGSAFLTATEALGGLALAVVIGLTMALVMFFFRGTQEYIMPYAIAIKATPVVAFAPLLALYLGPGASAKVIMSAMIAFFTILQYTWDALKSVPEGPRDYVAVLGASRWRDLRLVRMWFVAPSFGSALKVAAPLAVVGAIVAEFVQSDSGIGFLLKKSLNNTDAAGQFAATVSVAMVGFSFYALAWFVERWMLKQARMEREDLSKSG